MSRLKEEKKEESGVRFTRLDCIPNASVSNLATIDRKEISPPDVDRLNWNFYSQYGGLLRVSFFVISQISTNLIPRQYVQLILLHRNNIC